MLKKTILYVLICFQPLTSLSASSSNGPLFHEPFNKAAFIACGLMGAAVGFWFGCYFSPIEKNENKEKPKDPKKAFADFKKIVTYMIVGTLSGSLLFTTPYVIHWYVENKQPQTVEELNKKRQKEEARLINKFSKTTSEIIDNLSPEELRTYYQLLDDVKKDPKSNTSSYSRTALERLQNQLHDQLITKCKNKEAELTK